MAAFRRSAYSPTERICSAESAVVIWGCGMLRNRPDGNVGASVGDALRQIWPPFVLVAGLLLIGAVAASDGLFEAIGSRLASIPGNGFALFIALMGLVAGVTVVLNLDTSVVFLTPIVLHAARRRRIPERAFLYGVVLMSNSASLLLPGSNLTNLLVLLPLHVSGGVYASRMAPAWAAAVVITIVVLIAWRWRDLRVRRTGALATAPFRIGLGAVGIVVATVLVIVFENAAIPVAAAGIVLALGQVMLTHRMSARAAIRAVNVPMLTVVFVIAVALGTLARAWSGPGHLMTSVGAWPSALIGASSAAAVNNLPAAVMLSARPPAHPLPLLIGLNLGPNLVVWGSLSALLWLRVARAHGAEPSPRTYSAIGSVLVPVSIVAALLAL